jgi:scyllo-inositol 2-dehydrogenase (NADP+)
MTLVQDDPTWALEYAHFKALCRAGAATDLANDLWLHRALARLSGEAKEDRA